MLFNLIGVLLFVLFLVVAVVFVFFFAIVRKFIRSGKRSFDKESKYQSDNVPDKRKIFDDSEGEYVDFEDIKDEK